MHDDEKEGRRLSATREALLTCREMGLADRLAVSVGAVATSWHLMLNAASVVARHASEMAGGSRRIVVLAGPGNNGGDGYAAAALLTPPFHVEVFAIGEDRLKGDAALARQAWGGAVGALQDADIGPDDLVIDALFGAGLDRQVDGTVGAAIDRVNASGARVLSVDVPSGLNGDTGRPMGRSVEAHRTVTFFRCKPGHLLLPGRMLCGEVVVEDIGIPESVLGKIGTRTWANSPALWTGELPAANVDTHKYARGAVGVCSGGPESTGAARLAAMAAARAGAGAVTVLSPPSAVIVNASHLTSIMVRAVEDVGDLAAFLNAGKTASIVIGPGFGHGGHLRAFVAEVLAPHVAGSRRRLRSVVLDADALTAFADDPARLHGLIADSGMQVVMTPHEGEFARLFSDLVPDTVAGKIERARHAAGRSSAVVVLKGPDTVVAAPDGRAAINANARTWLATAGSGDVLAGVVAGLMAQGMDGWHAACAAVWLHAEAGNIAGRGLIAEDLPAMLPKAFDRAEAFSRPT